MDTHSMSDNKMAELSQGLKNHQSQDEFEIQSTDEVLKKFKEALANQQKKTESEIYTKEQLVIQLLTHIEDVTNFTQLLGLKSEKFSEENDRMLKLMLDQQQKEIDPRKSSYEYIEQFIQKQISDVNNEIEFQNVFIKDVNEYFHQIQSHFGKIQQNIDQIQQQLRESILRFRQNVKRQVEEVKKDQLKTKQRKEDLEKRLTSLKIGLQQTLQLLNFGGKHALKEKTKSNVKVGKLDSEDDKIPSPMKIFVPEEPSFEEELIIAPVFPKESEYTEFQWESTKKSSKITNNGMTAIAIQKDNKSGYQLSLGKVVFNKPKVYRWQISIDQCEDEGLQSNDIIWGVIEEKYKNKNKMSKKHCYGISTDKGKLIFFNMESDQNGKLVIKKGSKLNMVLNMKTGRYNMYVNDLKVATKNLSGKQLIPFVNLWSSSGIVVTLEKPFKKF